MLMKNENHGKKMVAPVIITVLMILYYIVYFSFIIRLIGSGPAVLLGIIPAALGAVSVYVCIQRIQEIRSGEEDDLSKY